jgi:prepilin peptidase CpaA
MLKLDIGIFILAIILIIASVKDIFLFKIPNLLTFSGLIIGIAYLSITKGYDGFSLSLAGAMSGFSLLIIPYLIGGTGAGDVKLLGVVGSFLGPKGVFTVFLVSCVLGGVFALFLLASKGLLMGTFKRYKSIIEGFFITHQFVYIPPNKNEGQLKIRFGLVIALGTGSYLFLRG